MPDGVTKISIRQMRDFTMKFHASAKDDKPSLEVRYGDDLDDWKERCPEFGSSLEEWPAFILQDIDADGEEAEIVRVKLKYVPIDSSATYPGRPRKKDGPTKRYSGEMAEREETILSHELYRDIPEKELKALQNIINGQETKDDGTPWETDIEPGSPGQEALVKIRKGDTSWLTKGFVWVEKFTTMDLDLSEAQLDKVFKIMGPPGPLPPTPAGANWLYMPPKFQQTDDGLRWDIEKRWQMSGENGWDPDMYQTDA